jgi:hypothetical protein
VVDSRGEATRFIGRTRRRWHGVKTYFALMARWKSNLGRDFSPGGLAGPVPTANRVFGKTNDA